MTLFPINSKAQKGGNVFHTSSHTHNRADVVLYSIQSILNQSYKNFELLIVGDGCTDDTESVVQKFASMDGRIRWVPFLKGKGFGYEHRNAVLKQATGKYIAYAAHDDLWFPDHLEIMSSFFAKNSDSSIAYTRPLWILPDGTIFPSFFDINNQHVKFSFMHVYNGIPATCIAHTKKALIENNYWNASLPNSADWDLWKRIILNDEKGRMGYISTPTTIHFRANWRNNDTSQDETIKNSYSKILGTKSGFIRVIPNKKEPLQEIVLRNIHIPQWRKNLRERIAADTDSEKTNTLALLEQNNMLLKQNRLLKKISS